MEKENNQDRFFFIAECFLDDERVMAHAISYFCDMGQEESIYVSLLSCKSDNLLSPLEQIAEVLSYKELKKWCEDKQKELDNSDNKFWKNGDKKTLDMIGWKI